jgi:FkbM family methyltransferase
VRQYFYNLISNFSIPKIKNNIFNIKHYGTSYGGYDLVHRNDIEIVISCGLGEDATFEIELLKRYNCKIIMIDPTPRAIKHYAEIKKRFGIKNSKYYNKAQGKQFASSYNLKDVNEENLLFLNKAITNINNSEIKLFFPKNKNFVSASLEADKNYSQKFFLAKTIDLDNVLKKFKIRKIDILKLDIEGGEILVLNNILTKHIFPRQILVEYKDIKTKNFFKFLKIFKINRKLLKNGYRIVNINPKGDYTYLKIS